MFQIIQDLIGNAVVSSGVSYEALCAILISSLFVIMIIGLVAGQELLLCKQAAKIFQTICKKETALKRVLRNLLSAISFAQI